MEPFSLFTGHLGSGQGLCGEPPGGNFILWGTSIVPNYLGTPFQKALLKVAGQGGFRHAAGRHTEQQTLWTDGLDLRHILAEHSLIELHFDLWVF